MNFNAPLLRPIRILLFPLSLVYGLMVWIRNRLFDKGLMATTSFNLPIVCIGNLSVGGTGKSTMVEFLVHRLWQQLPLAILSRGYKRKTRGYALADDRTSALEIGDEPMQFHLKFPEVTVAVGEERIVAIPQLLHDKPETKVIILDDAFQHRQVKAGMNILLTEYSNLFTRDWFLPTGDLRDEASSYKRSQVMVVTKCPANLSQEESKTIVQELDPVPGQQVYFSCIEYGLPYHLSGKHTLAINTHMEVLLVSGIANPGPLKEYLKENSAAYYEMLYSDHHIFSIDDWKEIVMRFESIQSASKIILTTEKDAVRLSKFVSELQQTPVFVMPIEMRILFGQEPAFLQQVTAFIDGFSK